jgi:DNA replication and repair protein RecF
MYLQKLSLINFKNYGSAELELSPRVNCFTGSNGEGKTNLLDAIHYLSFCKSFFNPVDSQNILHQAPFFMIQGTFMLNEQPEEVYCGLKRNQKKQFKRNKKEYTKLSEHIGLFPLVMISPADSDLIAEGSESRRKFIDSVISQYDKEYLDRLIDYNRVLSQRNALLKRFVETRGYDEATIDIWNVQLVELAKRIHEKRRSFIDEFTPTFQQYYEMLSGGKEAVSLAYTSHLENNDFEQVLKNALRRDLALQYTTVGLHKDDLEFRISDHPIKKFGSQGQQKSYLIALKLAQFDFIKKIKKLTPILLLDDIYDKLDEHRVKQLMDIVSSNSFGQIFISDTHPDRIPALFEKDNEQFRLFRVKDGAVEPVDVPNYHPKL